MTLAAKLPTYARLGLPNVARVAAYRLGLKSGLHPVLAQTAHIPPGPYFRETPTRVGLPAPNTSWDDALWWFGWYCRPLPTTPPDWFANPFSDAAQPDASQDWWRISDFGAGDIKGLWELSRMDWAVAWATQAAHGEAEVFTRLNTWLADWVRENPAYKGPNWKCGQEASIRVLHLVLVSWLLDQDQNPEKALIEFVSAHLRRIAPTMSYAIGQQNNHGTSEAAALFVGGSFLMGHDPRADDWMRKGRTWLEDRAQVLIEPDGSFSQYSVNYHRLMLDTYSLVEAWRRHAKLAPFSSELYHRLEAATVWLVSMTDEESGEAPNIGANDGANLLPLAEAEYRDFRQSGQLASALFLQRDAFGAGPWNNALKWLSIPESSDPLQTKIESFDYGGYHVLKQDGARAVLRYPRFNFRPSQADALHLDLIVCGRALLRDAGTFSYNSSQSEWFASAAAHNTVQFDGRDQMPRLSRFLFGDWLRASNVNLTLDNGTHPKATAGYTDGQGAKHLRSVSLSSNELVCKDEISGNFSGACLRWRLLPGEYELNGLSVKGDHLSLVMEVDGCTPRAKLDIAPESRHYLEQTKIPVLELYLDAPSKITTRVFF
ncbi:Heparinase II/III N-terminus [Roseivivax lentus]|uniref:Heparinase II/III N-terminus n=1 Tax=Roseivivax lentus TaxID=633194 RepID=A0A1N7PTC0_9RHOB|nr:alginate lyase family protein [Roseivivax lentus]SIT13861.1 Heparinase II/III N-terminus [Roseivivax lentus]